MPAYILTDFDGVDDGRRRVVEGRCITNSKSVSPLLSRTLTKRRFLQFRGALEGF